MHLKGSLECAPSKWTPIASLKVNSILKVLEHIEKGGRLIFLELPAGDYTINGSYINIKKCGMSPVHFVSRNTGHELVNRFRKDDFRLWYDPACDYITPLMETTFTVDGFRPVLTSGNTNSQEKWDIALAAAEKKFGKGSILICQVKLAGRTSTNPIAGIFAERLLQG